MMASDLRVLVVDDQAPILRFITSALAGHACATTTAGTAEQALERIASQAFDLVISDIKMPGLSGLDVLRAVKTRHPETPVVLITGAPSVDSAVFGLRYGAYDYLAKPFSAQAVRALVQRVCEDRDKSRRTNGHPAGLANDLARRQLGLEALCRIGELAMRGLAPGLFIERVLQDARLSLRGDAAVVVMRDGSGFTSHHTGEAAVVKWLLDRLAVAQKALLGSDDRHPVLLTSATDPCTALAAVIPGIAESYGVICVARAERADVFNPDETDLLLGYAQNTALAMERLRLGESFEKNLVNTITAFVNAIESKERYLKGHSTRVSLYAGELATTLGLSSEEVVLVCRGAMLHDLGKLGVLDPILGKPGRLTGEEYELIKEHVEVGYKILKPLGFLDREALAVRHHHERWDGTGYPDNLAGGDIPFIARVVSTADAFDAMTSDRPYRKALPLETAIAEIEQGLGTQFDPTVGKAFLTIPHQRLLEISGYWTTQSPPEAAVMAALR
jgi:putative nucleotidyltransferase with HDIG domain